MSQTRRASGTPWTLEILEMRGEEFMLRGASGEHINSPEDARLIVTAVNNFEAMTECLQTITDWLTEQDDIMHQIDGGIVHEAIDNARTLLARLESEGK